MQFAGGDYLSQSLTIGSVASGTTAARRIAAVGSVKLTVVLELLGFQRRAAESRPSKVMSKAF
ncbi:hypothetical protein, partial [Streptomyces sp. NPDC002287]